MPFLFELGNTTSNTSEQYLYTMEQMYPMLGAMGIQANLIQDYEMRDNEAGFVKRLDMELPNVLSNFYPKEPESKYNKLEQFYKTRLPSGINMYLINLFDVESLARYKAFNAHYDPIPPVEFLEGFIPQIDPKDILIARINIKDKDRLTEFLSSDAAQRIDLSLIPHSVSKEFVTQEEKSLSKQVTGWVESTDFRNEKVVNANQQPPNMKANNEKAQKETGKNADDAGLVEETPGQSGKIIAGNDAKKQSSDLDNQTSDALEPPRKGIPEATLETPPPAKLSNSPEATLEVPPTPSELADMKMKKEARKKEKPFSEEDVNFTDESMPFMDILNEYRAVPEPRSSQYLREISFKRSINGEYTIKVADILIDKRFPKDDEIDERIKEYDKVFAVIKAKTSIKRQISYMERKSGNLDTNPYVGPEKCKECHEDVYNIWKSSKHATSLEPLKMRGQENDERCLECHLTKWEQPTYYKKPWKFDTFAPEHGCETCHGPGAPHIKTIEFALEGNRKEHWGVIKGEVPNLYMKDMMADAKSVCLRCHDKANSPDFDFVEYWTMIEHSMPVTETPLDEIITTRNRIKSEEAEKARKDAVGPVR